MRTYLAVTARLVAADVIISIQASRYTERIDSDREQSP